MQAAWWCLIDSSGDTGDIRKCCNRSELQQMLQKKQATSPDSENRNSYYNEIIA